MLKKFFWVAAILTMLVFAANVHADDYAIDDFDSAHDYKTQGVAGTIWEGVYGIGNPEGDEVYAIEADAIDIADSNYNGKLLMDFLGCAGGSDVFRGLGEGGDQAPGLYLRIMGDFDMRTKITYQDYPVDHLNSGLIASVEEPETFGDQDQMWYAYFPRWTSHIFWPWEDGVRTVELFETFNPGVAWAQARPWMRMVKVGDVFTVYHSQDGITWNQDVPGTYTRDGDQAGDMDGVVLRVGVFSSNAGSRSQVNFEYFEITCDQIVPNPYARAPIPPDGAAGADYLTDLLWKPGDSVQTVDGHEVYFGTDIDDVNNLDISLKTVVSGSTLDVGTLDLDTTYYWKVVEVNGASTWEGPLWSFTTYGYKATDPTPVDGIGGTPEDTMLVWVPGGGPVESQDVYFGLDQALVAAGDLSVLIGDAIAGDANSIDPTPGLGELLEVGKTYYWRVDSDAGVLGVVSGDLWSFSTSYPFEECDNFDTTRDYLTLGTDGTKWDGIVGLEYLTGLNANDTNSGSLYLEAIGSNWDGGNTGVLLYKELNGNFICSARLVEILNPASWTNTSGLMAKVGELDDAGPGIDYVSVENWPYWSGATLRSYNNGLANTFNGADGLYYQLERGGNVFYGRNSFDGINWTSVGSPVTRNDMNGLPLQVGICQSSYGNTMGYAVWDDFCYGRELFAKASAPSPASGGGLDLLSGDLSWAPGDFAISHVVYFGTDINDVTDATSSDPEYKGSGNVVDEGNGRFSYDVVGLETLTIGQTYYWRIDEVNATHDDSPWKGDTWRFTVLAYSVVENFESYTETGCPDAPPVQLPAKALRKVWIDGCWTVTWAKDYSGNFSYLHPAKSGSFAELDTNVANGGSKSMQMYFDNDGSITHLVDLCGENAQFFYGTGDNIGAPLNYYSEVYAAVDDAARIDPTPNDPPFVPPTTSVGDIYEADDTGSLGMATRDFTGFKLLQISFLGDITNDDEQLYMLLVDGDGDEVKGDYDGTITVGAWQDWALSMVDLAATNVDFDLDNVALIYIGVGDRGNHTTAGGSGSVWFDDIQLLSFGVCIPDSPAIPAGDLNDDCAVNNGDLEVILGYWLEEGGSVSVAETFSVAHNYVGGVPFGIWDGLVDTNAITVASSGGTLTMESAGNRWGPGLGDGTGLLLYKNVDESFTATLKVIDVNHTNPNFQTDAGSLMVRAANLADAGAGEDFVSLDAFPGWDVGSLLRQSNNGSRGDVGGSESRETATPHWLKVTYYASTGEFYCSYSADGVTYTPFPNGYPLTRSDLANVPLQVGIGHNTWEDYIDHAEFDDFAISPVSVPAELDLYPDGVINFKDVAIIGDNWMVGPVLFGD